MPISTGPSSNPATRQRLPIRRAEIRRIPLSTFTPPSSAYRTIGKSLLGRSGYDQLVGHLKHGQQAILVAGDGLYSFKGSGYVRGGIFDRIELLQEGSGTRFRDRNHERLGSIAAAGAPALREIGLFTVPEDFDFDATEPWEIQLLVQRATGVREKAFLTFDLDYKLPDHYIRSEQRAPPAADTHAKTAQTGDAAPSTEPRRSRWRKSRCGSRCGGAAQLPSRSPALPSPF